VFTNELSTRQMESRYVVRIGEGGEGLRGKEKTAVGGIKSYSGVWGLLRPCFRRIA